MGVGGFSSACVIRQKISKRSSDDGKSAAACSAVLYPKTDFSAMTVNSDCGLEYVGEAPLLRSREWVAG